MKRAAGALLAVLALASCGQPAGEREPGNTVIAPAPSIVASTPAPAPPPADLSRHEGKYPFDKIDGVSFLREPEVLAAIDRSGVPAEGRAFILDGGGPQTPVARDGDRLKAWGCEAHNCDAHDWAVLIGADGTRAEVCLHDADAGEPPRWYADGRPTDKREGCG